MTSSFFPDASNAGDTDVGFLATSGSMAELIRSKDWSSTPLGPIATWPQSLRTTVSLCLASTFPINIVWGPQAIQIYNDGYRVVCGERHPAALGMDYRTCWKSAWPAIGGPFDEASRGETSFLENQRMFLFRNGYLEETFFTFSLSPIRDESGGIGGLFHPVTETTATMISERRTRAVRDLTANLSNAQSLPEVCDCTVTTLEAFAFDLPFVLPYVRDARDGAWRRMSHAGVTAPSPLAPDVLDPGAWPLTQAGAVRETIGLAARCAGSPCGPYEEAPDTGFALPVWYTGSSEPVALLVTAASSRLPLDELYRGFFELVGAAFGAAVSRVMRQEEERERLASLAALDQAKTQFFSNVSHEFRTPLTLMLGPLEEVLDDGALQPRPRALLDIAQRNAQRLLKLVNGLLDFTRMEEGRGAATFVPTDLARLTLDLSSNFRAACERGGLTLDVACPPLAEPVWVDRDSWEKIVLNLLSNAFKFTLAGTIRVSLRHETDADADGVVLTVADTGVGIAPEHVSRIFERFHRVDGQQGRSVEGTGIGLALVQEMVMLHGGAITVQSREGEGTVFQVRLPFGHAHLPAAQVALAPVVLTQSARATPFVDEALRWIPGSGAALQETVAMTPGASGTVLLADDNADMRDYVERVLADAGYQVTPVANGDAALAALRTGPLPDLLLSDVMMPGLDGFAVLDAVRADPVASEMVVILLSARAGQEARVQGLAAGADDYLVKPFSARELIARVDGAVKLARLRKDAATREHALRLVIATRDSRDALARSQAQVASLFEQTATGVLLAEPDGRLRRVNARFAAMLGVGEEVLVGRPLLALVHPDERSKLEQALQAMRASQQPAQLDLRLPQADGGVAWVTMAFTPFAAGATLLAVVLDISERVEAEQKLRRADRSKDEFLAMLAHELRNPLAPISAAAELMSRVDLDAERLRFTSGVITRQVRHMTGLVDDLLDVSRVTLGLVLVEKTVQDMKQVVADAVEQVRPLIDTHRHTLTVDMETGAATANVLGDHKRLVQVLSNLLNNAAKYTPPDGRIGILLGVEDDTVTITVSDNGPGVPADLQLRLFELFAQAARTPDRSQGGLGLGLALARKLVELHGGSIGIENRTGQNGSSFVVSLPRALEGGGIGEDGMAEEGCTGPVRVLVVDDNVDAADTLGMLLDAYGYQTIVEHGSQEGLATARIERPDVCILDIGLPGMDGNVLAQQLRADPRTRGALLIALTGYSQPQDRERSLAAGFDHHLAKPANIDQLVELLAELAPGVPAV